MIFLPFQLLLLLSLDALKTSAFRDPSLPNPYTYSFEHQDRRQPQQTALKQDRHRQGWPQTERKQNRQRTNSLETGRTNAGLTSNKTDFWQERLGETLNITSRFPRCFSHLWWCFSLSWPTAISSWPIPAPSGYHLNSSLRNCLLLSIMWIS